MLGIIFLGDNMRKITIIIITIGIILGFLIGIYLYNTNQESKNLIISEKEEAKTETKKETKAEDLESKTLQELKTIAKEKGLKGYSTMKKADLISALK